MMRFIWKGKPNRQNMIDHQIRGILSLSVFLALIPLIGFLLSLQSPAPCPVLSTAGPAFRAVEVVRDNGETGIYFVKPGTSVSQLLETLETEKTPARNQELIGGMKIRNVDRGAPSEIRIEKMDAATRLALGLPVDINTAGFADLVLVPGVGEKTADAILALRGEKTRFGSLEELKEICGIKEKKLEKLRPYLCVEP